MAIWEVLLYLFTSFVAIRMLLQLIERHREQVLRRLVAEEKARRRRQLLVEAGISAAEEREAREKEAAEAETVPPTAATAKSK